MRILFLLLFFINIVFANVAIVSAFKGNAIVARDGSFLKVNTGFELEKHDNIKTGDKTKLQLIFKDNTIITIGKNSNFSIDEYIYDETNTTNVEARFTYAKGLFGTITGKIGKINPNKFKINAKSATLGIRGTQFDVFISNYILKVSVSQGSVYVLINKEMKDILPSEVFIYEFKTGKSLLKDGNVEESKEFYEENEDDDIITANQRRDNTEDQNDPNEPNSYENTRNNPERENNDKPDDDSNLDGNNTIVRVNASNVEIQASVEESTDDAERQVMVILPLAKEIMDIDNDDIVGLKYGYWVNPNEDYVRFATFIDGETNTTTSNVISDYIDGTTGDGSLQATYNGGVASIVTNSSGEQTSTEGTIDLNIDFRNQDLTGNINLDNNWHAYINSGDVTTAGFSSTDLINGNNTNDTISSGSLNGNYYGDDAQSVGGTFTLTSINEQEAQGVFGANITNRIYTPLLVQEYIDTEDDGVANLAYGYWKNFNENLRYDTFIEGSPITAPEIITNYMDDSTGDGALEASYEGGVIALVTDNTGETTSTDGDITLNIDFKNQDLTGNIDLNNNWHAQIRSGEVTTTGFNSTNIIDGNNTNALVTSGSLDGNYYGDDAQSVGGTFTLATNDEDAQGVFGADIINRKDVPLLEKEYIDEENSGTENLAYGYWKNFNENTRYDTFFEGGLITSEATVANYMDGNTGNGSLEASYSGGVASIITSTTGDKTSSAGTIDLDIDFKNQNFTGNIDLDLNWHAYINSGTVQTDGFNSTDIVDDSTTNVGPTVDSGSINGDYYGNDAQSVGGTFTLVSLIDETVEGVFGADETNKTYTPAIQPLYKESKDTTSAPYIDFGYWKDPNQGNIITSKYDNFDDIDAVNNRTPNGNMPTSGTATYQGKIVAKVIDNTNESYLDGTVTLNIDFTASAGGQTVSVDFDTYNGNIEYWDAQDTNANRNNNELNAGYMVPLGTNSMVDSGGTLNGYFYGNTASSNAGKLDLTANGGTATLSGSYGAERP